MEAKRFLKILFITINLMVLHFSASTIAYDDSLGAHREINRIALDLFRQEIMPSDTYLRNSSLEGEECSGVAWDPSDGARNMPPKIEHTRRKSMEQWIIDGGWSADEPEWTMALVHFYDPTNPGRDWLTDQQCVVRILNSLSSVIDNPEISAIDWTFDTFDPSKEEIYLDYFVQDYSWEDAKKYYKDALASTERNNENYGKAWRALGETMHLMADMTVPAHVRNDGHAAALFDADPYESSTRSSHIQSYSDQVIYPPARLNYRDSPRSLMHNVAAFTNSNFLSKDTVPPPTGHTSNVFHTYPAPSIDGLTPDANGYLHAYVENRDIRIAAQRSWFSIWSETLPNPSYTIDNRVVIDQRSVLVPTAIRASAALLDRFLPRFEVKVTKKETEPGSGRYKVHGEIVQATDAWNRAEWPDRLIVRNGANIVITSDDGRARRIPVTLIEPERDLNEFTREVDASPEDEISIEYDLGGYVIRGVEEAIDLKIIRPFSEAEKGVTDVNYTFAVDAQGIPHNAEYDWFFDDVDYASGPVVSYKFSSSGEHTVKVRATWKGGSAEAETKIEIAPNQPAGRGEVTFIVFRRIRPLGTDPLTGNLYKWERQYCQHFAVDGNEVFATNGMYSTVMPAGKQKYTVNYYYTRPLPDSGTISGYVDVVADDTTIVEVETPPAEYNP